MFADSVSLTYYRFSPSKSKFSLRVSAAFNCPPLQAPSEGGERARAATEFAPRRTASCRRVQIVGLRDFFLRFSRLGTATDAFPSSISARLLPSHTRFVLCTLDVASESVYSSGAVQEGGSRVRGRSLPRKDRRTLYTLLEFSLFVSTSISPTSPTIRRRSTIKI